MQTHSATDTAELLLAANVQLAIAELGTGGAVAAALRDTDAAACITAATAYAEVAAFAAALRVSEAKLTAFGAVSAMVAAEAAAALIDTYEGGWGLAVLCQGGNHALASGVTSVTHDDMGCFIALGAPSATEVTPCAPGDIVATALALLKGAAEIRLATKRAF